LSKSYIQPSLLFFRTSAASRSSPRFLNETRIIPPLSYTTCVHALKAIQKSTSLLEVHFADGEADAYAVELAGRVSGYVLGNDSDFVVLHTEGYLGYIPLDEMVWQSFLSVDVPLDEDKSGFQAVRNSKPKWKATSERGRSLAPPNPEGMALTVTVYRPEALAEHLKIPIALLPLLGALVGNDYTCQSESNRYSIQSLFFEKHLNLVQRITLVANTIQGILSPVAQKRKKQKHQVGSVMDLIDRTVTSLLSRSILFLGSGEIDTITDRIVEGTLQYAIPRREGDVSQMGELWPTEVCALHEPEACPLLPMISRVLVEAKSLAPNGQESDEMTRKHTLRGMFLDAYRKGRLEPDILDTLNSGTFWPRHFLEDPDLETVTRSFSRPIRQWGYAIIHDAVGLPCIEDKSDGGLVASDEDELVDVIESDDGQSSTSEDDPLAPLKGELHRLRGSATVNLLSSPSSSTFPRFGEPVITEYIRRGVRVAQEEIIVKSLHDLAHSLLPSPNSLLKDDVLLYPQDDRLTFFLQVLHSDTPIVRALPPEQMIVALCLRWVLQTIHRRAQESDTMTRHKERWSKREAQCFLASFGWTTGVDARIDVELPAVVDRNVQLAAQTLSTMESIEHLSQILFLSDLLPSPAHHFSGKAFHAYLMGFLMLDKDAIPTALLDASLHGLEDVLVEERKQKPKKAKKETESVPQSFKSGGGGLFHLLADVEA
jgi:XPG domain containing